MADSKADPGAPSAAIYYLDRRETPAERVRRLQAEARIVAREHIERLETCLMRTAEAAREVAEGGDTYPSDVRELASLISEDLPDQLLLLRALVSREPSSKL